MREMKKARKERGRGGGERTPSTLRSYSGRATNRRLVSPWASENAGFERPDKKTSSSFSPFNRVALDI